MFSPPYKDFGRREIRKKLLSSSGNTTRRIYLALIHVLPISDSYGIGGFRIRKQSDNAMWSENVGFGCNKKVDYFFEQI